MMQEDKSNTPNKYEHDYIVGILENFMVDCERKRTESIMIIEGYARQLTAFMHGEIAREIKTLDLLVKKLNK